MDPAEVALVAIFAVLVIMGFHSNGPFNMPQHRMVVVRSPPAMLDLTDLTDFNFTSITIPSITDSPTIAITLYDKFLLRTTVFLSPWVELANKLLHRAEPILRPLLNPLEPLLRPAGGIFGAVANEVSPFLDAMSRPAVVLLLIIALLSLTVLLIRFKAWDPENTKPKMIALALDLVDVKRALVETIADHSKVVKSLMNYMEQLQEENKGLVRQLKTPFELSHTLCAPDTETSQLKSLLTSVEQECEKLKFQLAESTNTSSTISDLEKLSSEQHDRIKWLETKNDELKCQLSTSLELSSTIPGLQKTITNRNVSLASHVRVKKELEEKLTTSVEKSHAIPGLQKQILDQKKLIDTQAQDQKEQAVKLASAVEDLSAIPELKVTIQDQKQSLASKDESLQQLSKKLTAALEKASTVSALEQTISFQVQSLATKDGMLKDMSKNLHSLEHTKIQFTALKKRASEQAEEMERLNKALEIESEHLNVDEQESEKKDLRIQALEMKEVAQKKFIEAQRSRLEQVNETIPKLKEDHKKALETQELKLTDAQKQIDKLEEVLLELNGGSEEKEDVTTSDKQLQALVDSLKEGNRIVFGHCLEYRAKFGLLPHKVGTTSPFHVSAGAGALNETTALPAVEGTISTIATPTTSAAPLETPSKVSTAPASETTQSTKADSVVTNSSTAAEATGDSDSGASDLSQAKCQAAARKKHGTRHCGAEKRRRKAARAKEAASEPSNLDELSGFEIRKEDFPVGILGKSSSEQPTDGIADEPDHSRDPDTSSNACLEVEKFSLGPSGPANPFGGLDTDPGNDMSSSLSSGMIKPSRLDEIPDSLWEHAALQDSKWAPSLSSAGANAEPSRSRLDEMPDSLREHAALQDSKWAPSSSSSDTNAESSRSDGSGRGGRGRGRGSGRSAEKGRSGGIGKR